MAAGPETATGIGAAIPRTEDLRLLAGRGRFVDDIKLPDMAFAYVLRSPHGHARIRRIATAKAAAAPGVLLVLTAADAAADGLADLPCKFFPAMAPGAQSHRPTQPLLARGKVRHVGDRVAAVIALENFRSKFNPPLRIEAQGFCMVPRR